jgi:hypothetical protein
MLTVRRASWGRSLVSVVGVLGVLGAAVVMGPVMLSASDPASAMVGARPPGGSYRALSPARVADTRTGLGGVPRGPTRRLVLSTAGRAGVPGGVMSGVSAVAVNITVRPGSVGGFVTAYPTGSPRPPTSNVNFARGRTVAQLAVVPVNRAGQLTIEASAPAEFVVDIEGYFTTPEAASTRGLFNPLDPARIMDSRPGAGAGAIGPGGTAVVQVTGRGGVPATGVSAVVINTTITGPTKVGYVTDYPTGTPRPLTSTVNFAPGQTVANRAIVPVGTGGTISLYNDSGVTRPVIDVTGYLTDGVVNTTGGFFVPITASRVVDTRFWQTTSYPSNARVRTQKIAGQKCVLAPARTLCGRVLVPPVTALPRPVAVLLNITAVPSGRSGYLTAFPADSVTPPSSDVTFSNTVDASSLAFVSLGSRGELSVRDSGGFADVVADISGYFVLPAITLQPFTLPHVTLPHVTSPHVTLPHVTLPPVPSPPVTLPPVTLPTGGAGQVPGHKGLSSGLGVAARPVQVPLAATPLSSPPRPSGRSTGATGATAAQPTQPTASSSAAVIRASVAPFGQAETPAAPLAQPQPGVTAPSRPAGLRTALSRAAQPVTDLRLTAAAIPRSRSPRSAIPCSRSRAPGQGDSQRRHPDDGSSHARAGG